MRKLSDVFGTGRQAGLLFLRLSASALLFILLYAHLADIVSPFFAAVLFLVTAILSHGLAAAGLRPAAAVIITGAAFFLFRVLLIAVTGIIPGGSVVDFLSFRFDSGLFPLSPAAAVLFVVWFLVKKRPSLVPYEILLNTFLLFLLLWNQANYSLTLFSHPGRLAAFSACFILIEIAVLLLYSLGRLPDYKRRLLSAVRFAVLIIPLFFILMLAVFGLYSEGASKDGGGLMQPTLFRFDFSDYIKLETEISMDNDLVLLFRNYGYLNSVYLRRFYLSGYKPERGFFMQDGPGERPQQLNIPEETTVLDVERFPERVRTEQEYFIVNFDPSSLIAVNYPVEISPLTNWSNSSFLRNYRAVSETVEQPSWELSEAAQAAMNSRLYEFYTDYGNDEEIRRLAEEVTEGLEYTYDKVIAIMFYLHDQYFYSLKPGVAVDGNQLHHFLFRSKKGYCSYFAFSMALMCRSIGIPARVAAGFFIDPQSGILNVYPVREDMAHAWVEVAFEDFGWVEFDPTTDRLAPGEELEFGMLDSSEYSGLIEEIFKNDYTIMIKDDAPQAGAGELNLLSSVVRKISLFFSLNPALTLGLLYMIFILIFRFSGFAAVRTRRAGRRAGRQYYRARRMTAAAGLKKTKRESIMEHAQRVEKTLPGGFIKLAETYLEAVFSAPGDRAADSGADADRDADADTAEKGAEMENWRAFMRSYRRLPLPGRVLIWLFPFVRLRRRRGSAAGGVGLLFVIAFIVLPAFNTESQDQGLDFYLDSAAREQDSENYEAALNLLNEGIALYPDSWMLRKAAGDLYTDRELYNLAVDNYEKALKLEPDQIETLYQLSAAQGLLNLDQESILSLEKIISIDEQHYDALADLGWMYFKTYRLADAETLLLKAVEKYNDSPILYMTLGTVYSGLYDYPQAESCYLKSIELALDRGWDYFASVSYYNLSLLEHGFYNYEKSFEYTNKSIETGERAPGYIARAEIFLSKLDFDSAFINYQQAYTLDSTPLALMGLADLYSSYGLYESALANMQAVMKHDDDSWMYYFGVDPDRHRMETDRLLMDIYYGMSNEQKFSTAYGSGRLKAAFNRIHWYLKGWFYERRYRSAAYEVGFSNEKQGNPLDAAWSFYVANFNYKQTALKYLKEAEAIETEVAPPAAAPYLLEEGRLMEDAGLLAEAAGLLDPVWEKKYLSEALTELIKIYGKKGRKNEARRLSEQLYLMNPGLFIREAIRFPLAVDFKAGFLLKRFLTRSGFEISTNNKENDYRYRLTAADNQDEGEVYSVIDTGSGETLFSIPVSQKLRRPSVVSAFTAEIKMRLFKVSDEEDGPF